jgi:hypothetical protein
MLFAGTLTYSEPETFSSIKFKYAIITIIITTTSTIIIINIIMWAGIAQSV